LDDDDVFVLEEEDLGMTNDEESPAEAPQAMPEVAATAALALETAPPDAEEEESELRVRTDSQLEAFSADKSMFDLDESPAPTESAGAVGSESVGSRAHHESEGEMSMIEEIDASSSELEIIEEAPDPFALLAEASASETATPAFDAADGGQAWSTAEETAASQPLEETTWDEAQTEATAAALAEGLGVGTVGADCDFDEPTDADDFDPIYGEQEQADADAAAYAAAEADPDFGDHEETYAEAEPAMVVIGAPIRARRRGLRMFAAAAVLLIAGGHATIGSSSGRKSCRRQ
jgi:hypothetical protein